MLQQFWEAPLGQKVPLHPAQLTGLVKMTSFHDANPSQPEKPADASVLLLTTKKKRKGKTSVLALSEGEEVILSINKCGKFAPSSNFLLSPVPIACDRKTGHLDNSCHPGSAPTTPDSGPGTLRRRPQQHGQGACLPRSEGVLGHLRITGHYPAQAKGREAGPLERRQEVAGGGQRDPGWVPELLSWSTGSRCPTSLKTGCPSYRRQNACLWTPSINVCVPYISLTSKMEALSSSPFSQASFKAPMR